MSGTEGIANLFASPAPKPSASTPTAVEAEAKPSASTSADLYAKKDIVQKIDPTAGKRHRAPQTKEQKKREEKKLSEFRKQRASAYFKKHHKSHAENPLPVEEERRTIFIGNLPNAVKKSDLLHFFAKKGISEDVIESARIRCQVVSDGDGKKRGRAVRVLRKDFREGDEFSASAYVVFKNATDVQQAVQLTGSVFKNRHLSISREDAVSKAFHPVNSVYVGNLDYHLCDEDLWKFFIDNGVSDIQKVRVVRDRNSGACQGFAYVAFANPGSVSNAIGLRGKEIHGREVRICHVQKSRDPKLSGVSRRDLRQAEGASAAVNDAKVKEKKMAKKAKAKKDQGGVIGVDDEKPSWMGEVANPRKKLAKELRWLTQHPNDRKKQAKDRARQHKAEAKKAGGNSGKKK